MKINTVDADGKPNGYVIPLWSVLEHPELRPDQVYVTAIAPNSRKGPHLHMVRRGLFAIIGGLAKCVIRHADGSYSEPNGAKLIEVKPGDAAALYNLGDTDAVVINMPSPAWSAEDPDEHPVEGWQDPEWWALFTKGFKVCICGHSTGEHDSGGCCRTAFCDCNMVRS